MTADDRTPEPAREWLTSTRSNGYTPLAPVPGPSVQGEGETGDGLDPCEHGKGWDDDCAGCDALEALYASFGAVTPNEHGIAHRAYKAGSAHVAARLAEAWQRGYEAHEHDADDWENGSTPQVRHRRATTNPYRALEES